MTRLSLIDLASLTFLTLTVGLLLGVAVLGTTGTVPTTKEFSITEEEA